MRSTFAYGRRRSMSRVTDTWTAMLLIALVPTMARAGHPISSAPVPPSQEIVVLDPGVDPDGKPRVIPSFDGARANISIPPTVLVHKMYYTGDRTFQAQLLPGGPCVVAVNHPRDGKRRYVEVMLPPGAPRVTYRCDAITYDFNQQTVVLKFDHAGGAHVDYVQGKTIIAKISERTTNAAGAPRRFWRKTGINEGAQEVKKATHEVGGAIHDGVKQVAKAVTMPVTKIFESLPGANAIRDSKDFRTERDRIDGLEKAAEVSVQNDETRRLIP